MTFRATKPRVVTEMGYSIFEEKAGLQIKGVNGRSFRRHVSTLLINRATSCLLPLELLDDKFYVHTYMYIIASKLCSRACPDIARS